ncbi:SBBP repeat-containing protein [Spirosoma sp. BT702]|uniref:SBBP repeat-containing protein n=1 Tax=Spirosoma profusum TaxID=2771354 RepID=A0A927ASQ8_9BACT|nr:SBBP repeat-containing protein [Spirosoma profusum]MBD2701640.1 SBBP repeat-containing protein [Spirosoma profusum]
MAWSFRQLLFLVWFLMGGGLSPDTQAQNFEWAKGLGGTSYDEGHSVAVDKQGNVYTTGYFTGIADFDPGPGVFNLTSAGSNDIFVCKLSSSGNLIWVKQLGGSSDDQGRSIKVDGGGNLYITGYFNGTADFDPGPGVSNLISAGGSDLFVSKLDLLGNWVWSKRMGGSSNDFGSVVAIDGQGNVISTGSFSGTADFDPNSGTFNLISAGITDIFVSKLDASGNFVWAKRMGGESDDVGHSVTVDGAGNVFTTGYFNGTADFDPGPGVFNLISVQGTYDSFVSKLDASGTFVWVQQLGTGGSETGYSIIVDGLGNIYSTGSFSDTADFDPGSGVANLTTAGLSSLYVSKLDASGAYVWAKAINSTVEAYGFSIAVDGLGDVYTTGSFLGTADFDPGPGVYNLSSVGVYDSFVSKIDASGAFVWAQAIGSTTSDGGNSVAVDNSGNVYTTGSFRGPADFDTGPGIANLNVAGIVDAFVYKLSQLQVTLSPNSACLGAPVALSVVTSGGTAPYSYTWVAPVGTTLSATHSSVVSATLTLSGVQTFTILVAGSDGPVSTSTVDLTVNAAPVVTLTANPSTTLTCPQTSVTLTASGGSSYVFSGPGESMLGVVSQNATSGTAVVNVAGTYSVTVTTSSGCTSSTTLAVQQNTTPPLVSINPNSATLNCTTSSVSLAAVGSGTYQWNTGDTTSIVSATSAGIYSVTLTATNGCSSTVSASVTYQNCAPTLTNAIPPQSATLADAFSYTIPATTFTDAETPHSLTLSLMGLPAGLSFVPPNTITGTPSTTVGSPFSVTVTATDPGGLSASTSFSLTVQPRSFAITGVTMLDCNHISYFERRINFTVSFEATNGQPISLSVVNEARTVTIHEPYQLTVYTDNPVIVFKASQQGTPGEATFSYNWLAFCANGNPRVENAIPPQSATVGQAFSYTIPANTFTDAETPNSLTLSVVGLPAGLSFVAPNTITGIASASASAFSSVTVVATDPFSGTVSTFLPLSVVNPGGCGSMFTLKAGDWNDASVWSCGRVPLLTDVVTLNHAVSLPPTYQAQALRVIYGATGRLLFGASSRLRLGAN